MKMKPKLAMYWAASCGGCEIALTNIHEKLIDLDSHFDFFYCPCLLDTKTETIQALPDQSIEFTLFNGGIRTNEHATMAHLLRKKSKYLIAFGSCASEGCIPALGNLTQAASHLQTIYIDCPTVENPKKQLPQGETSIPEGTLHIPTYQSSLRTLNQTVLVDYFVPGCPPEPHQIEQILEKLKQSDSLPPIGSVLGGGISNVCNECKKIKEKKPIKRFYRTYECIPDSERCLLEQGIICMGIATRDGCGALCPEVNMPCTGCYGPPDGVVDQGAKMAGALGSLLDLGDIKSLSEKEIEKRIQNILDTIPDPVGTFYKYSLANSILQKRRETDTP
jgi:F420-non-reducing hydrogenase small subunit